MTSPLVGIALPIGSAVPAADLVGLAVRAEAGGLDVVAVGEYSSTDALALAAAIAARTERIGIETGVVAATTRSSALLAMGVATVAGLAGGRFTLGLGAGSPVVAGFHGTTLATPVATVRRTMAELRHLLAGGADEATGFRLRSTPSPAVPIHLSAIGPAMLRLAATEADGVALSLLAPDTLIAEQVAEVRAAGGGTVVAVRHVLPTGPTAAERERGRREIAGYFVVPTYRRAAEALVGTDGVEEARAAHAAGGMEALTAWVPDPAVDRVLAAADPDRLTSTIAGLAAAGADVVLLHPAGRPKGDVAGAVALIDAAADARRRLAPTPETA